MHTFKRGEAKGNEMESKLGFEIETCSRCGGSGHFSYNQIDGSRCFKCGGAKVTYTKRGQAAAEFYEAQFQKPLSEFKVGDFMRCEIMAPSGMSARFFAPVIEVKPERVYAHSMNKETGKCDIPVLGIEVCCRSEKYGACGILAPSSSLVRFGATAAQKAAALEKALAYQASLTKAGKPKAAGRKESANV